MPPEGRVAAMPRHCPWVSASPVAQPAQRVQDTSKRRRINRQRRGCDTFCNTCAGPASIASAASPQLGAYPPTAFELLCGELGTAEIRTFAELQLFREQVALETAVLSLAEARREVHALEQEAEECAAGEDFWRGGKAKAIQVSKGVTVVP